MLWDDLYAMPAQERLLSILLKHWLHKIVLRASSGCANSIRVRHRSVTLMVYRYDVIKSLSTSNGVGTLSLLLGLEPVKSAVYSGHDGYFAYCGWCKVEEVGLDRYCRMRWSLHRHQPQRLSRDRCYGCGRDALVQQKPRLRYHVPHRSTCPGITAQFAIFIKAHSP